MDKIKELLLKWYNSIFFATLAVLVLCSFVASVMFIKTSAVVGLLGVAGSVVSCIIFVHEVLYEIKKNT